MADDGGDAASTSKPRNPAGHGSLMAVFGFAGLALALVIGFEIYTHHGADAAVRSFDQQRQAVRSALDLVPLPDGAERDDESSDPFDKASARQGYFEDRYPLGELRYTLLECADTCPGPWHPNDGVGVHRTYFVPGRARDVCAAFSTMLTGAEDFKTRSIRPTYLPPSKCSFLLSRDEVTIELGVSVSDPGFAEIQLHGASRAQRRFLGRH
jgi:hypothetical protein